MSVSMDQVRQAKAEFLEGFGRKLEINGIGIGKDRRGLLLKVNLASAPADDVAVPSKICGVRLAVEVIGQISKRPLPE
jgi:hypothetical protein